MDANMSQQTLKSLVTYASKKDIHSKRHLSLAYKLLLTEEQLSCQ